MSLTWTVLRGDSVDCPWECMEVTGQDGRFAVADFASKKPAISERSEKTINSGK